MFTAEQKIEAAKKRLGDLKGVITKWAEGGFPTAAEALREVEHIAHSTCCYLDGVRGAYLNELPHPGESTPVCSDSLPLWKALTK